MAAPKPIVMTQVASYVGRPDSDLVVVTTLDGRLQRIAEAESQRLLDGPGKEREASQAAFVALSPEGAVRAMVGGDSRARLVAMPVADDDGPSTRPLHQPLEPQVEALVGEWDGYGLRTGDDLGLYAKAGIIHPAVWPALANSVVKRNLVEGPWVHTRSRIRHHGTAQVGATALVEAVVVDRFETRSGSRAVLDIRISVDGELVASLEHEALVSLHPQRRP